MDLMDAARKAIQAAARPLLLHVELTEPDVDLFDCEAMFIERFLAPQLQRHAGSKVVLEHITTRQGQNS
jgi:dihydroorotase